MLQLRLVNEKGQIVDIGEEGEVQIKSTLFEFLGYRGEPEKTKQIHTEDGFLKSGYVVHLVLVWFYHYYF